MCYLALMQYPQQCLIRNTSQLIGCETLTSLNLQSN